MFIACIRVCTCLYNFSFQITRGTKTGSMSKTITTIKKRERKKRKKEGKKWRKRQKEGGRRVGAKGKDDNQKAELR